MPRHGITAEDVAGTERALETLLQPLRYEGVDEWRTAVVEVVLPALGADNVSFQMPGSGTDLVLSNFENQTALRKYYNQFVPDLNRGKGYYERMLALGVGNRPRLWRGELGWFYRSGYYNECLVPLGAHDPLWMAVRSPASAIPTMVLAHHARPTGPRFGARGMQILRLLRPALAAATATVHRLDAHRATLRRTVDAVPTGVAIFGFDGRLWHRNPAADRLVQGPDGALLASAMARAAQARSPLTVHTTSGRFRLSPTRFPDPDLRGMLVVVEENGVESPPRADELCRRFRLSARQAEVALLLKERRTNAEIAAALTISEHTARHHVQAVLHALDVPSRRAVAGRIMPPGLH